MWCVSSSSSSVVVAAVVVVVAVVLTSNGCDASNCTGTGAAQHSRQKRVVYMSSDRRLTLPPESVLVIAPTLNLPFGRNLPLGYTSGLAISVPFKISFDDLGLTSEENPFGIFPDFFFRRKREADLPGISWAGGDREMMYQVLEDSLHNLGLDGQGCLLRAICEMFQAPLVNHGFVGEVMELFFSVSRAPHAEKRLAQYLTAERNGRSTGDCSSYHSMCPQSLFTTPQTMKNTEGFMNHYTQRDDDDDGDDGDGGGDGRMSSSHHGRNKDKIVRQEKMVNRNKKTTLKKQRKRCTRQYS